MRQIRGYERARTPSGRDSERGRTLATSRGPDRGPGPHLEDGADVLLGELAAPRALPDERHDVAAAVRVVAVGGHDAEHRRPRVERDQVVLVLVQLVPAPPARARGRGG